MKKFKYFPMYFVVVFCMSVIGQKFNLVIRGTPIGGYSWHEIWRNMPLIIIVTTVWAFIINQGMNEIRKKQIADIIKAEKRIEVKGKYHSMANAHECRVCGYQNNDYPWGEDGKSPSYQICPCCGVQYGVKDITPEEIQNERKLWVKNKYKWFDSNLKPSGWSSEEQLKNIPKIGIGEDNV